MRKFGKFLVFTNLILSLIFLGWSVALYTQRLDWAPRKNLFTGEGDPEGGQLNALLADIQRLVEHRDLAEARWQTDSTMIPKLYEQRATYQRWYADQLSQARTGLDSKGKNMEGEKPVRKLVPDRNSTLGLLAMEAGLREPIKDSRNQDVNSIAYYERQYKELLVKLDEVQAEITKLIQDNETLTEEIAGKIDLKTGKPLTRGIRGRLEDRINYKKSWEDEIAYLKPHLVNQLINVEEQKRRLVALETRLKELQGGVVAVQEPLP